MVNPGGTGRPIRHISARLAPLPPCSGFILPLPSFFLPNRSTNLTVLVRPAFAGAFFLLAAFFAIFEFVSGNRRASLRAEPTATPGPARFQKYPQCLGCDRAAARPATTAPRATSGRPPSPARRRRTSSLLAAACRCR